MNRLFGKGKPKEPGPSISDCITGVFNQLINRHHFSYINYCALYWFFF